CSSGFLGGLGGRLQDVNECADTTTCPAYATCTNTVGSYYCTCKQGFLSSNGQNQFRGPGVECKDVDECTESPPRCGPHSACKNMLGRYRCSCLPGFSSPTGDWVPGRPGTFSCRDIDECLTSGICPEHSNCVNSVGSYHCSCQAGFFSNGSTCEDVNECADTTTCPAYATCTNTVGSYYCTCKQGFLSSNRQNQFRGPGVKCEGQFDGANLSRWFFFYIDECVDMCPLRSDCTNTPGSYSCTCHPGFAPSHGQRHFRGQGVECRDVDECSQDPPPCGPNTVCTNTPGSYGCRCTAGFRPHHEGSQTHGNFSCKRILFKCKEDMIPHNKQAQQCQAGAPVELEYVSMAEGNNIESKVIKEDCLEENGFYLKAKGDGMKISCSMIKESRSSGSTGVAFVSFANMESVLDERFFQGPQSPRANFKQRLRMNSRIVGGIITGEKKDNLSEPVIYVLENLQPKQKSERPICVSWSSDVGDGGWTPAGCEVLKVLETHTVCSCDRLANLAIIMALEELPVAVSLEIISLVGLSLSLVCLVLAIATFLLCRAIRSRNTSLHLHLCVCLFLAKILFLTGVDKTDNQTGCAIIAGCLHYLFLACFSWTLVEAVTLFLMVRNLKVVNYFSSHNISMLYLCAFGYGFPGLVVAISASMYLQGYGTHNRCWLSTARGFIWSFLGPVSVIILINFVLLTWTLCILRQKLSSVNAEVSKLRDTRLLTFKAFAQFFILGCPWVLGFFQIGQMASIMAYLFTIINSLQGTFIFIIHCLLSRQVREEYRRWLTRKTKPSSQSQTSGILLSSMPSSSKTVRVCCAPRALVRGMGAAL
uniref:Adhesion G protein-coupled receptor E1 n=1 Tax=Marmota marmota marmota TaxID=9994 RepID=A0A8C6A0V0_MARMA